MQTSRLNRHLLWLGMLFGISFTAAAQVKIGNNPTVINSSALLELENKTNQSKGMILPKIELANTASSAMGNGAVGVAGMVVYNTKTDIAGSATYPAFGAGVYAFDGTGWVYGGIPSGGSSGQVLSKTATGLSWSTPSSGVTTYQVGTATTAGAMIKATGTGVTMSVNTSTQTATITVPNGVELLSVRLFDMAATNAVSSYGLSNPSNIMNIRVEYTGRTIGYASTFAPQMQVLLHGAPAVIMDTYGTGYPRQYEVTFGGAGTNFFTVAIPLMNPETLGNPWTVLMNF